MLRTNGPAALHRHGRVRFGKDCRVRPLAQQLEVAALGECDTQAISPRCPPRSGLRGQHQGPGRLGADRGRPHSRGSCPSRLGNRRTLGAIEAGRPTVPVLVIADEGTDSRAQVERIVAQYVENTQRAGLTQSEEVSVVATLFDLGLSAAQALAIDLSTPHLPSPRTGRSPSPCARSVAADRPASMVAKDSDTAGHDRQMVDGCELPWSSGSSAWAYCERESPTKNPATHRREPVPDSTLDGHPVDGVDLKEDVIGPDISDTGLAS